MLCRVLGILEAMNLDVPNRAMTQLSTWMSTQPFVTRLVQFHDFMTSARQS
jgi:hypothetical protein